jgi:hypothetical protein
MKVTKKAKMLPRKGKARVCEIGQRRHQPLRADRLQDRAGREHLRDGHPPRDVAPGIDGLAPGLHEQHRRRSQNGAHRHGDAPVIERGERWNQEGRDRAAQRYAGLLDRKNEAAMLRRGMALQDVAAGRRRWAIADADQEGGEQKADPVARESQCQPHRADEGADLQ